MAVTPNYGWPIPVATDYVKDGYDAIADLGNAIDTTVAGLGSGLNLITTNTFTAQSAVQLDNCFSATYSNYRFEFNLTAVSATDVNILVRLVDGTTPITAASYEYGSAGYTSSALSENWAGSGATSIIVGKSATSYPQSSISGDVFAPNLAAVTNLNSTSFSRLSSGRAFWTSGGGFLNTTTVYEGIQFFTSTGTMTGAISIYGYEK